MNLLGLCTCLIMLALITPISARCDDDQPKNFLMPADNKQVFNTEEVKKNVNKYLENIFGKKSPSLSSYFFYEGKTESEAIYEYYKCKLKWNGVKTDACKEWMKSRDSDPDAAVSEYYEAIRRKIHFTIDDDSFVSIQYPDFKNNFYFKVVVRDNKASINLELLHAGNRAMTDLFLISISKINGLDLRSVLGLPCDEITGAKIKHPLCLD